MAEKKYTGPGQFGQEIRSALSSAYDYVSGNIKDAPRKTKMLFDEYLSNPIYNRYPQLLLNPTNIPLAATKAGIEAFGGIANVPVNLSDNVLTQEEPEPPTPTPTLANRDLLSEYYGGFDNVPIRRAEPVDKKQSAQKLYRVMYAGKGAEASEIYETKDEADAALKKAGGKGAVAGINLLQKTRGGEMLSAEEIEARKQKYIDQLSQTKQKELDRLQRIQKEPDRLKRIQALRNPQTEEEIMRVAENKGRMEEALKAANEEKRAKDKKAVAEFASWRSKVKAGRESENQLRLYNKQLGLLKQAYTQARQAGDPITALAINQAINSYTAGVPMEMGARKIAAEKGIVSERNKMMADKMQAAQEEEAKRRQTAAANSDFNQYNQGQNLITRKPVGF